MAQQYGSGGNFVVCMAGPFGSAGTPTKITDITLLASEWKGAVSPYSQVVTCRGVSVNSMVNLQPSVDQLEGLRSKGVSLVPENDGGIVTVYAVGEKPDDDLIIQATILEVVA